MKTILVVDDEDALLETLTEFLQGEGYRVRSATNGRDGLACLREEDVDLVVTDLMMPIADGVELIRTMQGHADLSATPVVMLTGAAKATALRGQDIRVSAFLSKPFRLEDLLAIVVQLIGVGAPDVAR